ncbi:MAG: hypothetical protein IIA61_14340 [Candidatus Marinimicrobia bacterium]|nr:hypothetical protein [Candidatus Neomarinimicrobiota bacterium]
MFDYKHYVPILRWKRGERIALRELFSKDSSHITPLIELIPKDYTEIEIKKASGLEQKLEQAAEQFRMSWGEMAFLLDLWHLDNIRLNSENRLHPFVIFNEKARTRSLHMIPVTGFSRSKEYQSAIFSIVKNNREGICLRIYKDDLLNVNFQQNLKTILQNIDLRHNQVDLLVDLQIVDETCPDLKSIYAILPTINEWRSFTIARGAFPKDLTEFSIGEHLVPRNDWLLWFHEVTNNQDLQRIPTFSDYMASSMRSYTLLSSTNCVMTSYSL